jgi:peptidyl-dipeptidase Dcp
MIQRNIVRFAVLTAAILCIFMIKPTTQNTDAAAGPPVNPMTEKWSGPYGGVPPFDKVKIADFKPAVETAMVENLKEIDAIASTSAPPTFQNTIVALERTGATLDRVATIYGIWSGNMNSAEFSKVEAEMDPKIAAHFDKIIQNDALFKRIETVYN